VAHVTSRLLKVAIGHHGAMRDADFERLYAEHAAPLLGFLIYRTGDRALAEDLVADTFEHALRARRGFDRRKASEKTWIYVIALNCLRDQLRKRGAEARALERTVAGQVVWDTADWTAAMHDRDELARALESLSPEEREAVALRYGADLTIPEIAKLLKKPQSTARGRVFRGLGKLRDQLR
jgi:RNA polymerase sigma-70 factor (ECF subfamily)